MLLHGQYYLCHNLVYHHQSDQNANPTRYSSTSWMYQPHIGIVRLGKVKYGYACNIVIECEHKPASKITEQQWPSVLRWTTSLYSTCIHIHTGPLTPLANKEKCLTKSHILAHIMSLPVLVSHCLQYLQCTSLAVVRW